MTLAEIEQSSKPMLLPEDVARVIGVNTQYLRNQAHISPEKLGFPVSVIGSRVVIPREGFLYWMRHGRPIDGQPHEV